MNPALILGGALAVVVGVYAWHCEREKAALASLVASTRALGEAAEQEASDTVKENLARKELADERIKNLSSATVSLARELRDARASSRDLSAAAARARGTPGAAKYVELLREIGRLDAGVSRVGEEADGERVRLNEAKVWAQDETQ